MILSIIVGGLILYFIIGVIEKAKYNVRRTKELKEELALLESLRKSQEEKAEEFSRQLENLCAKTEKEMKEKQRNKNKLWWLTR